MPGVDAKKPPFFLLLRFQVSERLSFLVRKVGGKPMVAWVPRLVAKKMAGIIEPHMIPYDSAICWTL